MINIRILCLARHQNPGVILKLCGMREKRVEKEIKMAYPKPNQ